MNETTLSEVRDCKCGAWCGPSPAAQEAHRRVFGHRFIAQEPPAQGGDHGQD